MEDRGAIQAMKKLGHSNRAIARYLHCAPSTISNELKRGTPPRTGSRGRAPGYSAKRGDAVYKENRKNSHKPHRIDKCTSFAKELCGNSIIMLNGEALPVSRPMMPKVKEAILSLWGDGLVK